MGDNPEREEKDMRELVPLGGPKTIMFPFELKEGELEEKYQMVKDTVGVKNCILDTSGTYPEIRVIIPGNEAWLKLCMLLDLEPVYI